LLLADVFLGLVIISAGEGVTFLWNTGELPLNYTALQARVLYSVLSTARSLPPPPKKKLHPPTTTTTHKVDYNTVIFSKVYNLRQNKHKF
jgi:hypothetical protein